MIARGRDRHKASREYVHAAVKGRQGAFRSAVAARKDARARRSELAAAHRAHRQAGHRGPTTTAHRESILAGYRSMNKHDLRSEVAYLAGVRQSRAGRTVGDRTRAGTRRRLDMARRALAERE